MLERRSRHVMAMSTQAFPSFSLTPRRAGIGPRPFRVEFVVPEPVLGRGFSPKASVILCQHYSDNDSCLICIHLSSTPYDKY